jgi:hypothetical protein
MKNGQAPSVGTGDGFSVKRHELHHRWRIRKELPDGMFSCCEYNAPFPVTASTVASAPSVQRWLDGCRIDDIYHPEPESSLNKADSPICKP